MNKENLLFFQFYLIILIMAICIFKSVDLKSNNSSVEYAAYIYSIVMIVLSSFGILMSIILITFDFCK